MLQIFSVKRYLSGLNFRPATLKSRVLVISKLLIISSNKLRVTIFQLREGRWIVCKAA